MSSFGAKRKARVIKVADDSDPAAANPSPGDGDGQQPADRATTPIFGSKGRKPLRQSGLRKTLPAWDDEGPDNEGDNDGDGPAVVRPNMSRSSSTKKKTPKSRLSFGGEAADDNEDDGAATPKKVPLGKRALENSAAKRGLGAGVLPSRSAQEEDDRPRYSKEYLSELQSSTPNTPREVDLNVHAADEMELDSSELEGAMIVDSPSIPAQAEQQTKVLSEAEVREKKERRARLAKEEGFLALEDEDEDRLRRKDKADTRLTAEDEHVAEGFEAYVEDGGLSLGKRAEKERKKQDRKQMADLISAAEGHSSSESSDEDAERRMAYEAAQTRAGMDGLKKPRKDPASDGLKVPPKMAPLPVLSECIEKLQASLRSMEAGINVKRAGLQQLRTEAMEISRRKAEVQALLDETGKKYQEAMGHGKVSNGTAGPAAELLGQRGLESLGATSQRGPDEGDS